MLQRIRIAIDYLIYFFSSGNAHSVHSPFVYELVTRVINERRNKPVYHEIELIRSNMLRSKAEIQVNAIGAGKNSGKIKLRDLVRRSAKPARYAELLERICSRFQPEIAIELGTSVGISTMYQAIALEHGHLFSLEGNPDSARIARHNLEKSGLNNVQIVEGLFDDTLPMVLEALPRVDYVFFDGNHSLLPTLHYFELCLKKAHNDTVFVFDDIRWSEEMITAWQKIKNHPDVTVTIDLFAMGLVFFRKEQEKENFVIRF